MPTIVSHAFVGWSLVQYARGRLPPALVTPLSLAAGVLAMVPDADVVAFPLGIPYAAAWGHRGASHSLAFAAVAGAAVWGVLKVRGGEGDAAARPGILALALLVAATASHALLDMLTDGGLGVALLAPLSWERHFFPVTPVPVSPIGVNSETAGVIAWEALLLWPFAIGAWVAGRDRWPRGARAGLLALTLLVAGAGLAARGVFGRFW